MKRTINEYDNELIVGRIGKVDIIEDGEKSRVRLSVVENYDERDAEASWEHVTGFGKVAEGLKKLNEKDVLKNSIIVMTVHVKENGEYINKTINSFKIARFPIKKKEEE